MSEAHSVFQIRTAFSVSDGSILMWMRRMIDIGVPPDTVTIRCANFGSDDAMLRGIQANRQRPQPTAEQPATKAKRALQDTWMAQEGRARPSTPSSRPEASWQDEHHRRARRVHHYLHQRQTLSFLPW